MRRFILPIAAILLTAACSSGNAASTRGIAASPSVSALNPTDAPMVTWCHEHPLSDLCTSAGSPEPLFSMPPSAAISGAASYLPDDVTLSLSTIGSDTNKISHDSDSATYAADCRRLGADASSASVETLPNSAWQAQWRKTMGELQKSADECSSAQSTGDQATMQQALTDLTAADDDLITFNKMTG